MHTRPLLHVWAWLQKLAVGMLALVVALPAIAVDVTNLLDSGAGSLRDAISLTPDGGTIHFIGGATSGTITLTSGEIAFSKSLILIGPGANNVSVSGNNTSRIFNLADGTKMFAISGLTLSNGVSTAGQGGAITTNGNLMVDAVQFSSNQALDGGGAVALARTAVSDQGSATIKNSAFVSNSVSGSSGVGGGAIVVAGGVALPATLTMVNSTVSGNLANTSTGMSGGGIEFAHANVILISSTIAFNRAGAAGADIHQGTLADSTLTLRNSIVSNGIIDVSPITASDRDIYQPGGATIQSLGFNIVQRRSSATGYQLSDAPDGTDPLLAAIANNGGPTLTHALLAGSPAINFVPDSQCTDEAAQPLLRDQRGPAFVRQSGGDPCDSGAFEAQASDLTISKTHVGNFRQGQAGAAYSIIVTNVGVVPTSGTVSVVDTLPPSMTATGLSGTGWTCNQGTLTCTRGDALAASASYPAITVTVNIAGNAPASVANAATVSGGGELNTTNDTASDSTIISPVADLTISKTHNANFSQGQAGGTYTISVHNSGPGASIGTVTVTDTLPIGLTATALNGVGWACNVGTLTCTRNDALAPAASYPDIVLTVNVANNAAASVTNTATVSGGGELNTANNSANDVTSISAPADLTIAKTHLGNFTQGQTGVYTIIVSNASSGPTIGTVTVIDALPPGLTVTTMAGSGWTCNPGTLTCTRGDVLGGGASYPPIALTANVGASTAASVINTATVSGGGEINTSNDTATDATTIVQVPSANQMANIPTLSQWLLMVLGALLAIAGAGVLRKRQS